ncbi:MAG: GNAT family N-acetyltransferase [Hormoscilla sp. SP5CHS1]|nr:GNAT family N-acetyltransferase [Hormoscilla sp. SP5CHS1]
MEWTFVAIDGSAKRDNFDCGVTELNDYLKKYARQNHNKGIAKTFVALSADENREVIGYYSVSMDKIEFQSLPEGHRRGLPRYPVPAMLVGKLAVDRGMQGRGLGTELLMDCFRKAIRLSSEVGIFAVRVDAVNEQAKLFYLKYGFIPLENGGLSLFIPIATIGKALESLPT